MAEEIRTEEIKEDEAKAAPAEETEEAKAKKEKKTEKKQKSELAALKAELEKSKAELAELNDKYLRMAAEYDNYRRRSQKEKESIYGDAVGDVIADILPVIDNLDRAALYRDAEKVAEGLALTAKSAKALLAKLGIEEFGKKGDAFDPNLHNAVMHEESEEYGENVITDVFQSGYRKGDKIIRFAMVKVAN